MRNRIDFRIGESDDFCFFLLIILINKVRKSTLSGRFIFIRILKFCLFLYFDDVFLQLLVVFCFFVS